MYDDKKKKKYKLKCMWIENKKVTVMFLYSLSMEIQKNRRLSNDWAFKNFKLERDWHWLWFHLREAMFMRVARTCLFQGPVERTIILNERTINSYKNKKKTKGRKIKRDIFDQMFWHQFGPISWLYGSY